jgi:hypothetical protein
MGAIMDHQTCNDRQHPNQTIIMPVASKMEMRYLWQVILGSGDIRRSCEGLWVIAESQKHSYWLWDLASMPWWNLAFNLTHLHGIDQLQL